MKNLLEYVEEYLKQEGLAKVIPSYRKKNLFQSPPILIVIIWFGGLWANAIILTWGFGNIFYTIMFCVVSFFVFILVIAVTTVIQQRKNSTYTLRAAALGGLLIFVYPALIIGFVYYRTLEWQSALLSFILIAPLLLILVFINSTYLLVLSLHSIKTLLRVSGKSLASMLVIAPLLLIIVILSVFSQDLWVIVGNISWTNFFVVLALLFVPPLLLTYARIKNESRKLVGEYPKLEDIPEIFSKVKYFSEKYSRGLISPVEWENLKQDLKWRDEKRIYADFSQWIDQTVAFHLAIYIEGITFLLIAIFFIYFSVLFLKLLNPETIANWLGVQLYFHVYDFEILEIRLPFTIVPLIKVSLLLSAIVAITARVSIVTNDDFRENTLSWLSQKSKEWMAASVVYRCLINPYFQFWEYKVKNANVFNSHIVIPENSVEIIAKSACYKEAESAGKNVNLIIVTAFEKENNRDDYDFRRPGKRWQLLINRKNNVEKFSDMSLSLDDDIRYAHNLGFEYLKKKESIPDAWFGDKELAVQISKEIWMLDKEHSLIWHPYVDEMNNLFFVDVCITRKFPKSTDYQVFLKQVLTIATNKLSEYMTIDVKIEFRDSMDILASVEYFKPTEIITYKDEYMKKRKHHKYASWITKDVHSR